MLVVGLFTTFSFANRALAISSWPLAARLAQSLGIVAIAIFAWPALKSLFTTGPSG